MSEEVKTGGVPNLDGGTVPENPNLNELADKTPIPAKDLEKDFFKVKERMRLAEARALEAEQKLEDRDISEAEAKGNLSEVVDSIKEKNRELVQELHRKDLNFSKTNIKAALKQEALKRGCSDASLLVRLVGEDKIKLIGTGDDFEPDMQDVNMIIDECMKEYEHINLFNKPVNLVDRAPNNTPQHAPVKEVVKTEKDVVSDYMKERGFI